MIDTSQQITSHYGGAGLYDRILAVLAEDGLSQGDVTEAHLKPIDEFHIGGAAATKRLLDSLTIGPETRLLDIGSGIGGPARMIAAAYGAKVTGIDLTPDFVETARKLTALTSLDIDFVKGSALDLPFGDGSFDMATLLHVGMNLPDKPRLFQEVARVLGTGGVFAVYDVMLFGNHPEFPLPWASTDEASFLETPETYLSAAQTAGLELTKREDRGEVAKAFFADMQKQIAEKGPPRLGLPLLMGETAPVKVSNMVAAVNAGDIQPVEMIFQKP